MEKVDYRNPSFDDGSHIVMASSFDPQIQQQFTPPYKGEFQDYSSFGPPFHNHAKSGMDSQKIKTATVVSDIANRPMFSNPDIHYRNDDTNQNQHTNIYHIDGNLSNGVYHNQNSLQYSHDVNYKIPSAPIMEDIDTSILAQDGTVSPYVAESSFVPCSNPSPHTLYINGKSVGLENENIKDSRPNTEYDVVCAPLGLIEEDHIFVNTDSSEMQDYSDTSEITFVDRDTGVEYFPDGTRIPAEKSSFQKKISLSSQSEQFPKIVHAIHVKENGNHKSSRCMQPVAHPTDTMSNMDKQVKPSTRPDLKQTQSGTQCDSSRQVRHGARPKSTNQLQPDAQFNLDIDKLYKPSSQLQSYDRPNWSSQSQLCRHTNSGSQTQLYAQTNSSSNPQLYGQANTISQTQLYEQANSSSNSQLYGQANTVGQSQLYGQANTISQSQLYGQANTISQSQLYGQANFVSSQASSDSQPQLCMQANCGIQTHIYGKINPATPPLLYGQANSSHQSQPFGQDSSSSQVHPYRQISQAIQQLSADQQATPSVVIRQPHSEGQMGNTTRDEVFQHVPNHITASILAIFCCWPLGILALMKSTEAKKLKDQGRYLEAVKKAHSSCTAVIFAIIFGIIFLGAVVGFALWWTLDKA